MPLIDSNWELGKCAYKALQYMSLKLPVVASPVGVNKEIISNGINGMLAKDEREWYDKILELYDDNQLYTKISENGYNTVLKQFSLNKYKLLYLNILKKIISVKKSY